MHHIPGVCERAVRGVPGDRLPLQGAVREPRFSPASDRLHVAFNATPTDEARIGGGATLMNLSFADIQWVHGRPDARARVPAVNRAPLRAGGAGVVLGLLLPLAIRGLVGERALVGRGSAPRLRLR
jgi:hypothetical protein